MNKLTAALGVDVGEHSNKHNNNNNNTAHGDHDEELLLFDNDDDNESPSSMFFTITTRDGELHLFEALCAKDCQTIAKGIRCNAARLSRLLVEGKDATTLLADFYDDREPQQQRQRQRHQSPHRRRRRSRSSRSYRNIYNDVYNGDAILSEPSWSSSCLSPTKAMNLLTHAFLDEDAF